jgi:hypothetical protein
MAVVWTGLEEYRAELARLPDDCTGEAANLIEAAANGVAHDIKAAYPARTGKLRDKVTVTHVPSGGRLKTGSVIKNTARHAAVFEHGSQARHTSLGANRGSMPPGKVFVPRIVRARRTLTQQLKDMVARHGAKVSGEP